MNLGSPYADFVTGLEGPVLEVLARSTRPLTGRQVQKLAARGSVPGVAEVLQRLGAAGLVVAEPAGRAILYRGNRQHICWPVVESAMSIRAALIRRIAGLLADWSVPPEKAALFGSVARGEGDSDSDVDILLVHPETIHDEWDAQLLLLAESVREWTGNDAHILDVSSQVWQRMTKDYDPVTESVEADGIDLLAATWTTP